MRLAFTTIALALVAAACAQAATTTSSTDPTTAAGSAETTTTAGSAEPVDLPANLAAVSGSWATDWSMATVDLDELLVGIPSTDPRDRIPPIDDPAFVDAEAAPEWLGGNQPGVVVEIGDEARFYPLAILTRHEIVNDEIDGTPVAVTYCPLCNTAVVFDRRLDGDTLRLGVSGLLRNSDLVMWDDATESLWQQVTGEAIVGELAGRQLTFLPSRITSFAVFTDAAPSGLVLADDQGFGIRYGANPYVGYSSQAAPFSFFQGEPDDRLPALERVVGVEVGDESVAYPFSDLAEVQVVNDEVDGEPIVVLWGAPDTADALDASSIGDSRGVGTGVAYRTIVDGEPVRLAPDGSGGFVDEGTGSTWDLFGRAVAGPLEGARLDLAPHRNEFFFAWAAFFPDGEVWSP